VRELTQIDALSLYEEALLDAPVGTGSLHAVGEDGSRRALPIGRWLGTPDRFEAALLGRAVGPVLDIGCGAGRHVVALGRRGVEAAGVEISPVAVEIARSQGAEVIEGSIFAVPLEARWRTVLLLDGNIGIGGDAAELLRHAADLLAPGGQILVELEAPDRASPARRVRLESGRAISDWMPWHFVGADEIGAPARAAGLAVEELWVEGGRWFACLRGSVGP
jgi:SAM-dependent methyltransferase